VRKIVEETNNCPREQIAGKTLFKYSVWHDLDGCGKRRDVGVYMSNDQHGTDSATRHEGLLVSGFCLPGAILQHVFLPEKDSLKMFGCFIWKPGHKMTVV
jgi:hypothetical protein